MENTSPEPIRAWVERQMDATDPAAGWQPDAGVALARFRARARAERRYSIWRRWALCAAAGAAAIATVVLLPAARVAAQQFWQFLTVRQVAFIRVNPWPDGVPSPQLVPIGRVLPPLPVRDLDEARWHLHYEPRLPHPGILSGSPGFLISPSLAVGTVIRTADLELALQKAGVTDQSVPTQWDGAQLTLHTGPIVIAQWKDAVLAQSPPWTLSVPQNVDFPAFAALVLRVFGVAPQEAQRLVDRMGTAPLLLAPVTPDLARIATIEEIQLHSGPAILLTQTGVTWAHDRITLFWSVPDRVYLINGTLSRSLAIVMANAVE
jgi:hypothetical protein